MNKDKNNTSKPSYRYAVVSISIVLYFLGVYLLLFFHSSKIDQLIKEQVNIVIELDEKVSANDITNLENEVETLEGVIPNSIKFHNKSEAIDVMGNDIMDGFANDDNPFRDMLTFNLYADAYTDANLIAIDSTVKTMPYVFDVFYESESDVGIHHFVSNLAILFLILSLIFIGLALVIIHNTLSLSLYADRWEIKTMELVGARKSFIRRPYVAHGRIIGQWAFVLAAIALIITIGIFYFYQLDLGAVVSWYYVVLTLVILLIVSTVVSMISTFTVVNKFIDSKLGDLYS